MSVKISDDYNRTSASSNVEKLRAFLVFESTQKASQVAVVLSEQYQTTIYRDMQSLVSALGSITPNVILCDQLLLDDKTAQTLDTLKSVASTARILVIGGRRPIAVQIVGLKHGARGYFNDEVLPLKRLSDAISLILQGEVWIERGLVPTLIDEMNHVPQVDNVHRRALKTLSPKELEVATLVSHGATNKMIAKNMNITERTVKAHLTMIFQKMNLPDRLSLAIVFRDLRP